MLVYKCTKKNEDDDDDEETVELANSDAYPFSSDWYGDSSNYGFGVSDALVILLNRRGFNIKASAV